MNRQNDVETHISAGESTSVAPQAEASLQDVSGPRYTNIFIYNPNLLTIPESDLVGYFAEFHECAGKKDLWWSVFGQSLTSLGALISIALTVWFSFPSNPKEPPPSAALITTATATFLVFFAVFAITVYHLIVNRKALSDTLTPKTIVQKIRDNKPTPLC